MTKQRITVGEAEITVGCSVRKETVVIICNTVVNDVNKISSLIIFEFECIHVSDANMSVQGLLCTVMKKPNSLI